MQVYTAEYLVDRLTQKLNTFTKLAKKLDAKIPVPIIKYTNTYNYLINFSTIVNRLTYYDPEDIPLQDDSEQDIKRKENSRNTKIKEMGDRLVTYLRIKFKISPSIKDDGSLKLGRLSKKADSMVKSEIATFIKEYVQCGVRTCKSKITKITNKKKGVLEIDCMCCGAKMIRKLE
jgi:translation initiation factor 2 beta subunit (eIF-2beta)/eIF-5